MKTTLTGSTQYCAAGIQNARTHPDSYRENFRKYASSLIKILLLFFSFSLQTMAQYTAIEAWVQTYNGTAGGPDGGKDIAVDSAGNVYVAGASVGSGSGADFLMAKYDPNGDTLWVRRYNGTGNGHDVAVKVILDANGNILVCGNSFNASNNYDFLTLKYDTNGNLLWAEVYDGTGGGNDEAKGLAVDGGGNVYVGGASAGSGTGRDYALVKYDAGGTLLWVQRFDGAGMNDALTALGTDGADNIIVTGFIQDAIDTAKRDIVTIKYNSSGQQQWFQVFNGSSDGDDRATAMAVDDNGSICITGLMEETGSGMNMVTIKYDGNGTQQWAANYNGPANQDDIGFAIAVDNSGNTYVTGTNFTIFDLNHDFVTIKYNSIGDTVWVRRYNGPGNSNDIALDIALDDSSNVYVTGYNFTTPTLHDYATIKYSNDGVEEWVIRYNGSLNGDDGATAIAVDKNQNVYVTGISNSSFGLFYPGFSLYSDIVTVKYGQQVCNIAADAGADKTIFAGQSVQIGSAPVMGNTYSWTPITGLSDTTIANPIASPTMTTDYVLTVTDINGCFAMDTIMVSVALKTLTDFGKGYSFNNPFKDSVGMESLPSMYVYDRFGNAILLEDLHIGTLTIVAGVFRLHFTDVDNNPGTGFDDNAPPTVNYYCNNCTSLGEARRNIIIQMFSDLSMLLNMAQHPYPGLGVTQFVEVEIRSGVIKDNNGTPQPGIIGAASQYYLDVSPGITYGAVWEVINTGFDPYYNLSNPPLTPAPSYHAYLQINFDNHAFYTDLSGTAAFNLGDNQDLYTIALHEAIHALGFASLIDQNGNSKLTGTSPGRYSMYDTRLITSGNLSLLDFDNFNDCYNSKFNSGVNLFAGCNTISFAGNNNTGSVVYSPTPDPWSDGSSLSHFNCSATNGYTMNFTPPYNQYIKRAPHTKEVQTLCDMGYTISGTYGDGTYSISTASYPGACGTSVEIAGCNDFRPYINDNSGTDFTVPAGQTRTFTFNDFLANDNNISIFSCPEVIVGGINDQVNILSSTSFQYVSDGTFSGVAVLRYRPVNASNQRGNIIYIFINVTPPPLSPCNPDDCNLVCHGNFEEFISANHIATTLAQFTIGGNNANSPDLCTINGNKVVHIAAYAGNPEGIVFELDDPILPNCTADISFMASKYDNSNNPPHDIHCIVLGGTNNPCAIGTGIVNNCSGLAGTCATFESYCMVDVSIPNDVINPVVNGICSFSDPNFIQYSSSYINNTGGNINFVVITSNQTVGFLIVDDIVINSSCQTQLSITPNISNPNPCVGDDITIDYLICVDGTTTTNINNIDFQVNLPPGGTIAFSNGGDFNINGQATIPGNTLNAGNNCTTLTLNLKINGGIGIPQAIDIGFTSGNNCFTSTSDNYTAEIIPGISNILSISKIVDNLNPAPGDPVLSTITLCNNSIGQPINNIIIKDDLPGELIFTGSSDFTNTSGVLNSIPISLSPGQCVNLTFNATVSNAPCNIQFQNCVDVISANGVCNFPSACVDVDINTTALPFPNSSFFISPSLKNDVCMGQTLTFTNNSTPVTGVTYTWNFGDGTPNLVTTSNNPVTHTYNIPGYFQVILTVTDNCAWFHNSAQAVNIIPSTTTYNANCCSSTQCYDINDIVISAAEEWSTLINPDNNGSSPCPDGVVRIRGTVMVPYGSIFTIKDIPVEFGPNGKIIVKRGGLLRLQICTLTGLNTCGTMWQGIEVWGNPYKDQVTANSSSIIGLEYQGKINLFRAFIKNAHIGILLGKNEICFNPPPQYCPNTPCFYPVCINSNYFYGGGVIEFLGPVFSAFNQCGISIKTTPYKYQNSVNVIEYGYFNYSNSSSVLDPGYTAGNSYTYPNTSNPFYGKATQGGKTPYHIYIWKNKGVTVQSCTFQYAETAIELLNSTTNIGVAGNGNNFSNLNYGISAYHSTTGLTPAVTESISENDFSDINGIPYTSGIAIREYGNILSIVHDNEFFNDPILNAQTIFPFGIYTENANILNITDNTFTNLMKAVITNFSKQFGGSIYENPNGNNFNLCGSAFESWYNNPNLFLRCNHFFHNGNKPYYKAWQVFDLFPDQGFPYDPGYPNPDQLPAGNDFQEPAYKQIFNWSVPFLFKYYRHNNDPLGCGQCITPTQQGNYFQVIASPLDKTPTSCDLKIICRGQQYLDSITIVFTALETTYDSLVSILNHGQAQSLVSALNTTSNPNGNLKNLLIQNSPLSDTVLFEVIKHLSAFSPGNFKNIILANSPVSSAVWFALEPLLSGLPPGIAQLIVNAQAYNPGIITPTFVSEKIRGFKSIRQLSFNACLQDYVSSGSLDSALTMLENENTFEADEIIFGTYFNQGELMLAQQKLSQMIPSVQDEVEWKDIQSILLQLAMDSLTEFDIDSAQEAIIRTFAYRVPQTPAVTSAKAILKLVFQEDVPLIPPPTPQAKKGEESIVKSANHSSAPLPQLENSSANEYSLGKNYPDPFKDITYIPYNVPESEVKATLLIRNVLGETVKQYELSKGNNILEVSTDKLSSGLFIYVLTVNEQIKVYNKMVLIK